MADQITITVPEITAVSLTPNPAAVGQPLSMAVTVDEITKILTPIPFTSGEIHSGEN